MTGRDAGHLSGRRPPSGTVKAATTSGGFMTVLPQRPPHRRGRAATAHLRAHDSHGLAAPLVLLVLAAVELWLRLSSL